MFATLIWLSPFIWGHVILQNETQNYQPVLSVDTLGPHISEYSVLDNSPLLGEQRAYQLQLLLHVLINTVNQTSDVLHCDLGNWGTWTSQFKAPVHFLSQKDSVAGVEREFDSPVCQSAASITSLSSMTLNFPHIATDFPTSATSKTEALGTATDPPPHPKLPAEYSITSSSFILAILNFWKLNFATFMPF